MSRLVIYHGNCIDGFTAAWAAWKKYGDNDTEYLPANYGDPIPYVKNKDVLIVDFSYKRDEILQIKEQTSSILVYDHHKTAQEALSGLDFAVFDMNRSGAGLTWDILHGTERPWIINYVEDRDIWKWNLENSKEINAWIGSCKRDSFEAWDRLNETPLHTVGQYGKAVLTHVDRYVSEMCGQARIIGFNNYQVPVVNAPYIEISELLNKLATSNPFAVGWYQNKDGKYVYSLRSSKESGVDVSEIAKLYGGGGHKNSAGFILSINLFQNL